MVTVKSKVKRDGGVWLAIACTLTGAMGCRDLSAGLATSTAVSSDGARSTVPTTDAFKVTVTSTSGDTAIGYYLHSQGAAFSSASCSVAPGTVTPNNDIYCYVDVNELDLFFNGLSLHVNSPPSMCDYTRSKLYSYWGLQAGNVPAGATCLATVDQTTGVNSGVCSAGSNLTYDGAQFVCDFDYSASDGPNCCAGQYVLTTKTISSTGTTFAASTVKMTGSAANCLVGPGKDVSGYQSSDGYPLSVIHKSSVGSNFILDFASPISKLMVSNLYLGNYWNPTDYQRTATVETGSFPPADANDIPVAFQTAAGFTPSPYYEFGCMDKANDYNARIRVVIRSWDTVANFTATTNPYTDPTTLEPGFNSDYLLHDRSVWTDYSPTHLNAPHPDLYPGMGY